MNNVCACEYREMYEQQLAENAALRDQIEVLRSQQSMIDLLNYVTVLEEAVRLLTQYVQNDATCAHK